MDILDQAGFTVWTSLSQGWAYVAAAFIVIVPLCQELWAVSKQLRRNKEGNKLKSALNRGFSTHEVVDYNETKDVNVNAA